MDVVATKLLVPPARPGQVTRVGPSRLLDGAWPVTLVVAPAGFGKTTLVSGWLRGTGVQSAWLTLDEDDDAPERFVACLVVAVGGSPPRGGSPIAVVAALVNELAAADTDLVLVLDDFQAVTAPEILEAVMFLVEHRPPRLRLVLVGREEPDLPLARWRGRGLLIEIGAAELLFSAPEAAALLRSVTGAAIDDVTAAALNRRAEGWAAGLQMLGIGLRDGVLGRGIPTRGDRYVFDYLAEEVLRGQPEELRDFLRRTCVLDRLTPSLCDAVTGRDDGAEVIRRLERASLFLSPLDDAEEWHRYHGLFAGYLRASLDPSVAAESHRRAAAWYADHGMPAETIRHAVAGGDIALAVATFRASFEVQLRRGELASLLAWLNRLPDEVVRSEPDLAGFKGWLLYLGGRIDDAESYAGISLARMPDGAPPGDRAMLGTFRAYLALTHGDPERAASLAGAALDLLGPSTSFFRAAAMGALGQARRLTGDRRAAIKVLRAAVRLGERSDNSLSTLEATGYLAPLLYVQGRLREALLLCEDALRRNVDAAGRPLPMAGLAEVPLGTLLYERDDIPAARRHLVDGIARCEQLGTTSYTLLGLRTLARLYGPTDEGFRALLTARRQAEAAEDYRRARLVVATIAELHLRAGSPAAAEQVLREISGDQPSSSDYEQLTRARLHIGRGRPRAALDALAEISARAEEEGRDGSLIAILVVGALARRADGDPSRACDLLSRALELAATDGYRRTFLDEGPAVAGLLRRVRGTAPAFVADLLARLPATPERQPAAEPRFVEGAGVVEPLTDTQRRILELIATGMSNQQVADALFITVGTTKWHVNQIFGRLQVRNRTEAVARARELQAL